MADTAYLQWPFFEPQHVRLARALDTWCHQQRIGQMHGADVDAQCKALVQALGEGGWLQHAVAGADVGGAAAQIDTRSICLIRETLARHNGLADFAFAMQGLGSGAISLHGTSAQRASYLPRVTRGLAIAAFALSEPQAGSDVAAMRCAARQDGDSYVLDGEKTWISNGGIADFYVVFARTGEAPGARGISAFIVDANTPGLEIAERIDVMAPHPLARLRFAHCRVPASALLGQPGEGFKLAMRTLDVFRTSVAAAALGFARRALHEGRARAQSRRMFGATLADFQITQAKLAQMAIDVESAALLTYRAAWQRDSGQTVTREAAMAKYVATENAQKVIDAAVQLFGGLGVVCEQPVERLYREIRALRIYEGASEVQLLIIARDMLRSAHVDTFAQDNLPPPGEQPEFLFNLPELQFPARLNCATELLDRHIAQGRGQRLCIRAPDGTAWTYADLQDRANRIAHVLVQQMGLVPGNRVLLFSPNNPMMVACWFAVMKAGGVAVTAMPLLRAKELGDIIQIGQISHALADHRLAPELEAAMQTPGSFLQHRLYFGSGQPDGLEAAMQRASGDFANVNTASDDVCLLGFTSGTTGKPKATMHYHRDVMAICRCWPRHVLRANEDDVFIGSPPLGFTFGLGGLVLFPMDIGACTVLLEKPAPDLLFEAIESYGASVLFTAPTAYRHMASLPQAARLRQSRLRKCVSAGEALPATTRALWKEATGIELIDGIGATELLHIFISADEASARPGATGKPVPGYVAQVQDDAGREVPPGTVGKLAVKGPTGCRYLNDERQRNYVRNGWNMTGDAYVMDEDGYFHYQARTDDMIVSAGYNIAAPEVEEVLMQHPDVAECAVVGAPDPERGQIVKAFVVLRESANASDALKTQLQDFVKHNVASYKYPRAVVFMDALPKTATGKLQRSALRQP